MTHLSRRDFLKLSGLTIASLALTGTGCSAPAAAPTASRQVTQPGADQAYLAVARGADPAAIVQGALGAGAKRVRVMDMPFGGTPASAYAISGIEAAVNAAGGEMEVMSPVKFAEFDIPGGKSIQSWEIYRDIMEADVLIDVPIAKHHSLARLTLGGKNLLGAVSTPNLIHQSLAQRIADLASIIRPTLTVVDAYRILKDHGPTGGSLNDVQETHTVIASHDMVAADAYGATLFGLKGEDVLYPMYENLPNHSLAARPR